MIEFFLWGILAGAYGAIIGAGGGLIAVPVLIFIYGFSGTQAVGTSMALVLLTSLSATIIFTTQHRVDFKLGVLLAIMAIPGSFLGSWITKYFNSELFKIIFGIFLIMVSLLIMSRSIVRKKEETENVNSISSKSSSKKMALALLGAGGIGILAGNFGIGGGILLVPLLIYAFDFKTHIATATAQFVIFFTALSALLTHFSLGHVNESVGIFMGAGAILGAVFGAWLSKRLYSVWILRALSLGLLFVGARMIF